MVIRPLDDRTYCFRSAFTYLGALAKGVRHCSQKKCLVKRTLFIFSSISNRLAAISKGVFSTPALGLEDTGMTKWVHSIAHSWVPIISPLTHIFSSCCFGVIQLVPKHFCPPVRLGYDDNYRYWSCSFVEQQKGRHVKISRGVRGPTSDCLRHHGKVNWQLTSFGGCEGEAATERR